MTYDETCKALASATEELEGVLNDAGERSLNDEEVAVCDQLEEKIRVHNAEIDKFKEDAARRKRAALYRQTLGDPRDLQGGKVNPDDLKTITEPKRAITGPNLYPGHLRGFEGEDARENAYRSGLHILASTHPEPQTRAWAKGRCDELSVEMLANVQKEGANVIGGYLVFPEFEAAVVKLRNEYGVLRANARVKPMASDTLSQPRRVSGLTVYYPEEGGEITSSNMTWDQLSLIARKMAVMARWTTELDEDAVISMAVELADEVAFAFSKAEDTNGFIGTGSAIYGGMRGIVDAINDASGVTYAGSIATAVTANTAFSTLDLVDFEEVVGLLPQYARLRGPKWYISHIGFWASMARLIDAAGGNTGAMIAGDVPFRFLGLPVVITDVMNTTTTAQTSTVLALCGSLSDCVYLGTRRGMTVKTSDQRYIEYDQLAIQATQRVGISCYPGDPEAPLTAAGPIIALKTPSA